jgi:hypothetical protein
MAEVEEKKEGVEETQEIITCSKAKEEILRLITSRQDIELKLLTGFDKKLFKEKKQVDRKIRRLFEDFSVCDIPEEPETLEEPVSPAEVKQ